MQRFMEEKNLSLYLRRLLAEQKEMDGERRQVILKLLAEEEAKADRVNGPRKWIFQMLLKPRRLSF